MSMQYPAEQFALAPKTQARTQMLAQAPRRGEYGRAFDLHPALFALTFGAYMTYIGIMAAAFADPEMAIPVAIFAIFVLAGFGTPALWARIAAPAPGERPAWATFMREGFECLTGHVSARGVLVQVLIMPVLLLFWGVGVAIIAACVR
jgi:hypothetical protein